MKFEIICIGEELLKGNVLNANAAFLSKSLTSEGYLVQSHRVVTDEEPQIKAALQLSMEKADGIILTGGLGPTLDDLTKKTIAAFFGRELRLNSSLLEKLKEKYQNHPAIQEQAMVLDKAEVFFNDVGSAPGMVFLEKKKWIILLPGVPFEMEKLWERKVFPYLLQKEPIPKKRKVIAYHLCLLKEIEVDKVLRNLQKKHPEVEIGIYPDLLHTHVTFAFEKEPKGLKEEFEKTFSTYIFSKDSESLPQILQNLFLEKKWTLALAESCTGGKIASLITENAGASQFFLGSIVTYSNSTKEKLLNVSTKTLKEKGAVSKETAREMLEGLLKATNADYGIAVTGIAGPDGGTKEKPVGTVFIAMGTKEKNKVGKFYFPKDRIEIIKATQQFALASLWRFIKFKKEPFSNDV